MLDVPEAGAHDIIGDRAFSFDPDIVSDLGRAVVEGTLAGGVLPVIKHVPGHGRARADSHLALPEIMPRPKTSSRSISGPSWRSAMRRSP